MKRSNDGDIPSGWQKTKLGELLTIIRGVSYKKQDASSSPGADLVPILRATNIQNRLVFKDFVHVPRRYVSNDQLLRNGDIVVAASSGSRSIVGKAAPLTTDWFGSFGTFCFGLRPKPGVEPGYLAWFLQTSEYRNRVSELAAGVNINNLRATHIEEIPILVAPLPEQWRIVAEIEKQFTRLEAGAAALRRVQANLKRYRAAVLKAACEGRLVPTEAELAKAEKRKFEKGGELLARILAERRKSWHGRGKYKEPAARDTANLPPLPAGWMWATPDQLSAFDDGAICAGPFGTIFKARDFRPEGVPIIFLRHVTPGRYLTRRPGFMDVGKWEKLFKAYSVFGGELLVTKLGEPPGVCAIYPEGIGPAMVTPDVIKMTPNANVALPQFMMHYFNSQTARDFATGVAFGTTRLRVTLPIFREMPVPVPSLAEQTRIVDEVERCLSVVEELDAVVSASLQRATRLRQSVLQSAFNGALTETSKNVQLNACA